MRRQGTTASVWARRLAYPDGEVLRALRAVYGADQEVLEGRLAVLRSVVAKFIERFGDRPVRLFRSPGRINLRGMHVDTHGGYLNLMTHQREVVVAASPEPGDTVIFVNVDGCFEEVSFRIGDQGSHEAFRGDWLRFITHPDVQETVLARRGHWGNYLKGAVLSAQHRFPDERFEGLRGVVGSDLTRGAALSSSMAVCVTVALAALGCNGKALDEEPLILAVRDAEWYAGARSDVSDQAAMILGGRDELVNVALLASDLDVSTARRMRFPDALRVLVVNSYTERSLSGAALIEYTRNRFAYSLAIEIIRQEMRAQGVPEDTVAKADRLSNLSPTALEKVGGTRLLFRLLQSIPENISLSELRERYDLPNLDAAYARYFGTAPEELRPATVRLRGPLLFGIAESERARAFLPMLVSGELEAAGRLVTVGHAGDRRLCADGTAYEYDVGDEALARHADGGTPIEQCPGVYGASSPVLDALVDAALGAGALGASLTGGGIAGTVLALCHAENAGKVADVIRTRLAAPDYARLSGRETPLSDDQVATAVVANCASASAGELML